MNGLRLKKKDAPRNSGSASSSMTKEQAAETLEAFMDGNLTRIQNEQNALLDPSSGGSGASGFNATARSRRPTTMRRTGAFADASKKNSKQQVFFREDKFKAFLKGIIDVQGRMGGPFTLLINFGPRIEKNDSDYTKYDSYFALHVSEDNAWFTAKIDGGKEQDLETDVTVTNIDLGLDPDTIQTYWLSYDRDNLNIKYGKGYAMEQTTLLTCDLSEGAKTAEKLAQKRKKWSKLFAIYDETRNNDITILLYRTKSDIDQDATKKVKRGEVAGFINVENVIEVRKEPLTVNPSPFVLDSAKSTLNIIDKGMYIFSSELPAACRVLYETIKNTELDMEFDKGIINHKLSDAIRYSIETEGALLNKVLKKKDYLRITMGKGLGQSPGIPYVLEIWPQGARSPIHNHGAVCAVIKVLYGTIQSGCYNKVTSSVIDKKGHFMPQELLKFNAYKDEVTWMSPEWFQTHQLRNVSKDYCATVQCYRYDDNDDIQWNQFDFVKDENGEVGNFFPNTDFTFGEMREKVLAEYEARLGR
eukprot:TRINITY_DN20135_c0_g1_i10.p1 TRINITY_DN20135_c0_g1~~TRINITY_DN20135_c0_g1_i10.p1  ORF type:complete len:530 (-),score=155.57 TRINITY_DN20135_c0_g1_i10:192-1781(-)